MYRTKSWMLLVVALFVLPHFSSVDAQWVMAAHAAKNRIQQMKQKSGNGGYDVAIVLLEAAPNAVYDKTLKTLQTHPEIKITKNDSKNGRIEISKDTAGGNARNDIIFARCSTSGRNYGVRAESRSTQEVSGPLWSLVRHLRF
jgi:hypothetical protein